MTTGILIGGSVPCPVACPSVDSGAGGIVLENINAAANGTTIVDVSSAYVYFPSFSDTFTDISMSGSAGWKSAGR